VPGAALVNQVAALEQAVADAGETVGERRQIARDLEWQGSTGSGESTPETSSRSFAPPLASGRPSPVTVDFRPIPFVVLDMAAAWRRRGT